MLVTKKAFCGIVFEIITCIMLSFWISHNNLKYSTWIVHINIVIFFLIIQQIIIMKFVTGKILHFSMLFIAFAYLFLLSYQYLLFIGYDFGTMSYAVPTTRYDTATYMWACNFATKAIQYLYTGMLVELTFRKKNYVVDHKKIEFKSMNYANIAVALTIMAIIANVYQLIHGLVYNVYQGTNESEHFSALTMLMDYIAYTLLPSVMLLIYSKKDKRGIRYFILTTYLVFECALMVTGVRAQHMINIIVFLYFYFIAIEKIRIMTVVSGVLGAMVLLYMLIIIRYGRATGDYFSAITFSGGNVVLNTMSEFGFTINTLCIAKQSEFEHMVGGQFIFSFLSIVPKVKTLFPTFSVSNNVYDVLNLYRYGSSFVTDIYFDFGENSGIIFAVYGLFVQKCSSYFENCINKANVLQAAFIAPFLTRVLFTVRTSYANLPRLFFWIGIYMAVIYFVFSKIRISRKYFGG